MNKDCLWIEYGTGMVYMKKKRYETAEEKFNKILAIDPSYGYAYAQLGYIRKYEGKKKESINLFNKAIKYLPKNEMGIYQCGLINIECGNYDDALDHFSKVLELNPVHIDAMLNLGLLHGRKGNFEQAVKLINVVYHENQKKKNCFAKLGWIKTENQDWKGAFDIMNKDWKAKRMSPAWQVNLAQMYGRRGEFARAIEMINEAYALNPNIKNGFARLGWIKTEVQDWSGALGLMTQDQAQKRISSGWQTNLAMILVFNGEHDKAIKLIEDLYSDDEDAKDGYAKVGWAYYLSSGDEPNLRNLLEKDAILNRLSTMGNRIRAWEICMRGDLISAEMQMDSLYSKNPLLKDGFAVMGWMCIERGNLEEGLTLMEKDYRLQRFSTEWRINYAYQLVKKNQLNKSRALFNGAMKIEPHRQEVRIGHPLSPLGTMTKNKFRQMIGFED